MDPIKEEFKSLLLHHGLSHWNADFNLESFTESCALIVEREKAKLTQKPDSLGEWKQDNEWTKDPP